MIKLTPREISCLKTIARHTQEPTPSRIGFKRGWQPWTVQKLLEKRLVTFKHTSVILTEEGRKLTMEVRGSMTQQNTNQALCDTKDALMQLGFELSAAINIGRDTTRLRYIEDRLKHVVETLEQNIEGVK